MRIALSWFFCIAVLLCFLLPTSTLASGSKYHGKVLEMKASCTVEIKSKGFLGYWNSWLTSISFFNKDTGHERLVCSFDCIAERTDAFTNIFPYSCNISSIDKSLVDLYIAPNGTLVPGTPNAQEKLCKEMFSFLDKYMWYRDSYSKKYIEETFVKR